MGDPVRRLRLGTCVLAVLALGLLSASIVSSLWWGFGRDQAIFAWVGDVILRGGVPYRDAWELKGPGTHLFYAAAQAVFGRHLWGIRALDALCLIVSLGGAAALLASALDLVSALLAVALFGLIYDFGGYWYTAQSDGWIAMSQLVLAALLLSRGTRGLSDFELVGAGLLVALGASHKPQFVLGWLALVPVILAPGVGARAVARAIVLSLAGVALPLAGIAIWLGARHALGSLVEVLVLYNLGSHVSIPEPVAYHVGRWMEFAALPGVGLATVLAAGGAAVLARRESRVVAAAVVLLAVDAVAIWQGKWYFQYHFLPLIAVLCVLASAAIHAARNRAAAPDGVIVAAAILLALLQPAWPVARATKSWLALVTGHKSRASYDDQFGTEGHGYFEPTSLRTADYLRAHAAPGDCVLVWTFDPLPLFASGLPACDRFGYNLPLVTGAEVTQARYRAELLGDFERRPPAFVVVGTRDEHNMGEGTSEEALAHFDGLRERIADAYELAATIDHYQVYERRHAASAARGG